MQPHLTSTPESVRPELQPAPHDSDLPAVRVSPLLVREYASREMQRDEALEILRSRTADIRRFGVSSLALFGSFARDEARDDSDVDLLVELEGPATFDRYMDLKFYLEGALGRSVDLVTRKGLRPRLRPSVEAEAIRVA